MVYVDYLVMIGDLDCVRSMKKKLNIVCGISDLLPLSYFLGIAVNHDDNQIYLSQKPYAQDILPWSVYSFSHPCSTHLSTGTNLRKESGALL
jgi:hypothetical protein